MEDYDSDYGKEKINQIILMNNEIKYIYRDN